MGGYLLRSLGSACVMLVAASVAFEGCGGCEFEVITREAECDSGCDALVRKDVLNAKICVEDECLDAAACPTGQACVMVGAPVCLPICFDDESCTNGLHCRSRPHAATGEDTQVCFFPETVDG